MPLTVILMPAKPFNVTFVFDDGEITTLGNMEYSFALNTDCQYIGVGAIWTTQTKSDAKIISHDLLLKIIKENKKQIVAIGGINLKNIKELINIKIQTFCMISELLKADNMNHIVKYINH